MRRHLVDAVVGDVADDDAVRGRAGEVDVVETDPVADDDLDVGAGGEHLPGDRPPGREDAVGVLGGLDHGGGAVGVGGDELRVRLGQLRLLARVVLAPRVDVDDGERGHGASPGGRCGGGYR